MKASSEIHYEKLARMYASAPVNASYAPTLVVRAGEAEVSFAVGPSLHHAAGAVHGAVYFKALDDAAFFAAQSCVRDVFVLTVSFNLYLVRPVVAGTVRAVGRVTHQSRRLLVAESVLTDARGRELARGSGSFLKSTTPLTEEIGYR